MAIQNRHARNPLLDKMYSVPNSPTGTNTAPSGGQGNIYTVPPPPSSTPIAPYSGGGALRHIMSMARPSVTPAQNQGNYAPYIPESPGFMRENQQPYSMLSNQPQQLSGILQHIMKMLSNPSVGTSSGMAGTNPYMVYNPDKSAGAYIATQYDRGPQTGPMPLGAY